ncbi:hypothetical protein COO60DRAFT_1528602 [Scenedesmus sp. NREL 46B-D3]|nr:hypothetical protein COO60DRAFT_1528602 [Scenedesmus sp. NREL 46B-D3]
MLCMLATVACTVAPAAKPTPISKPADVAASTVHASLKLPGSQALAAAPTVAVTTDVGLPAVIWGIHSISTTAITTLQRDSFCTWRIRNSCLLLKQHKGAAAGSFVDNLTLNKAAIFSKLC